MSNKDDSKLTKKILDKRIKKLTKGEKSVDKKNNSKS